MQLHYGMMAGTDRSKREHVMTGFPLVQAGDGEMVEIVSVDGGIGAHRKLADLGLTPGKRAEVVTRQPGGPVLVAVGGTRIAVGFGLAMKVKVTSSTDRETRS